MSLRIGSLPRQPVASPGVIPNRGSQLITSPAAWAFTSTAAGDSSGTAASLTVTAALASTAQGVAAPTGVLTVLAALQSSAQGVAAPTGVLTAFKGLGVATATAIATPAGQLHVASARRMTESGISVTQNQNVVIITELSSGKTMYLTLDQIRTLVNRLLNFVG